MQKAVETYIAKTIYGAERLKILKEAGLVQREYSPTYGYSKDYPLCDADRYYREAPVELTHEEWEAVKTAYESQHTMRTQNAGSYNPVSKLLKIFAIAIYVIGFILGIVLGRTVNYLGGRAAFSFASALVYWIAFFVAGTMMYGFSEIVRLLQVIADK